MPTFSVFLTASMEIEIEAEDEEQAKKEAIKQSEYSEFTGDWEIDFVLEVSS